MLKTNANNVSKIPIKKKKNPIKKKLRKKLATKVNKVANQLERNLIIGPKNNYAKNMKMTHREMADKYFDYYNSYARALLVPEVAKNAKIPSIFPQETSSIHRHHTIPLTVSANGKLAGIYNPYMLSDSNNNLTSLAVSNAGTLNLITPDTVAGMLGVAFPVIPPNIFSNYRLVSCSLIIVPQMSAQTAQGTIGGGIYIGTRFDPLAIAGVSHYNADTFTVASNIDNLPYSTFANCTALESLRMIYFPADPTYEQYVQLNTAHSVNIGITDFIFAFYITGAPANANFNLEVYLNFEATPYVTTESYIPVNSYRGNEDASKVVKEITKHNDLIAMSGSHIIKSIDGIDEFSKNEGGGLMDKTLKFLNTTGTNLLENGIEALINWF